MMNDKREIISLLKLNDSRDIETSTINAYNTTRKLIINSPDGFNKKELLQYLKYPNFKEITHKEIGHKFKNKFFIYKHTDLAMRLQTSGVVINRNEISKKTGHKLYNKLDTIRVEYLQEQRRISQDIYDDKDFSKRPRNSITSPNRRHNKNISVLEVMHNYPCNLNDTKEVDTVSSLVVSPGHRRKSNYAVPLRRNTNTISNPSLEVGIFGNIAEAAIGNLITISTNDNPTSRKKIMPPQIHKHTETIDSSRVRKNIIKSENSLHHVNQPLVKTNYFGHKATKVAYENLNSTDLSTHTPIPSFQTNKTINGTDSQLDKLPFINTTNTQSSLVYLENQVIKNSTLNTIEVIQLNKRNSITSNSALLPNESVCCGSVRTHDSHKSKANKIYEMITDIKKNSESINKLSLTLNRKFGNLKGLVKEKYNPNFKNLSEQISYFPKLKRRQQLQDQSNQGLQSDQLKQVNGSDYLVVCKTLRQATKSVKFQDLGNTVETLITKMDMKKKLFD